MSTGLESLFFRCSIKMSGLTALNRDTWLASYELQRRGQSITVRGSFGVFLEGESADLSVLGRDVTNNFSVIYDYPNQIIALLAPPHSYEIKASRETLNSKPEPDLNK